MRKLKPPQVVIFSFLIAILIGAVLLSLPQSSSDGESIGAVDAFFTATSATCVTGLIVKDTGTDFSDFGRSVILFLIQIGGLGIMTLSTFFAILLGRKLTLRENVVVKGALDHHSVLGLKTLILYILGITFCLEAIGAALLYNRFGDIYASIFHAISAFCNAGFSLNAASFALYRQDAYVNLVMIALIILGGIGFIVLIDIPKIFRWAFRKLFLGSKEGVKHLFAKLSLQTKMAVSVSAALLLLGAAVFFLLENHQVLDGLGLKDKILTSFFQSTTSRTAGFNTVSIADLASPTLFFIIILMFIGASPGSTGGGIKTCTFGVLLAGAWSMIKNRNNIQGFKRTIPRPIFRKAVMIAGLAVTWIVGFTMLLSFVERGNEAMPNYFLQILFEVTSAFGTVGLSTGITPILSPAGKFLIMITMFVGRIGPLTLALAVAMKEQQIIYKYPEEKVMVG
ncbi:MAG: potassium transporter TrkG [Candidatus Gorgyraea atricola]|nr:potassium transporter TrkG [Candidatus Gorgyraea atricola]